METLKKKIVINYLIMKKITLLTFIFFNIIACKAQTIYDITTNPEDRTSRDNYYLKDINNYNDSFIGVWKWEDGLDSFEITLQEFERHSNPNTPNRFYDKIYGKYKYFMNKHGSKKLSSKLNLN